MRFLVIPLAGMALAGCVSRQSPIPLNTYQSTAAQEAVPPAPTTIAEYRINALDEVRINVFGEPELTLERVPVSPGGTINLPLAGRIAAEGRTTAQLSGQIAAALNRYLRNPQVAVNVTQFTSQKVTVEGSVRTPGVYQALAQMSLMDAIALGSGLNDYAKSDEILVFRRQGSQRYVARFDLGQIQNGTLADPTILPGDVVVVGYSSSRRFFSDAIAALPAAVGVFIALFR